MAEPALPASIMRDGDRHFKLAFNLSSHNSLPSQQTHLMCFCFKSHFHLSVNPFDAIRVMLSSAIEVHRAHVLRASLLPGVAIAQPIISLLNLDNDMHLSRGGKNTLIR